MVSLTYRKCRFIWLEFTIISSTDSATKLAKFGIKDQVIDLLESKQTLYGPIYSLGLVELETLKIYTKMWPMELFSLPFHKLKIRSCFLLEKNGSS